MTHPEGLHKMGVVRLVQAIPDSIRQLTAMRNLELCKNQLGSLSDGLGALTQLTQLHVVGEM